MDLQKQLLAEYDREVASTRKMLDAIPGDADLNWKANPKSMALGRLAAHVAETAGFWPIETLSKDELKFDLASYKPWQPDTKAEILSRFDQDTAKSKEILASLPAAKWDDNWKMTAGDQTWIDDSRYNVFRTWALNHMIHHRAQLGRDLRMLGVPIPGMYGPSADER
ncbi:MAG TPA: DinB family protein [Acidobacteriaceae bacterium]|nr:DinB family protein [Acidobacteriaceae bacterium]